jgi:16S rRNA (guanine(1405)-N(7))-methyltransferase
MRKPVGAQHVAQLLEGSRKYADVDAGLIATLIQREGAKAANAKDAAKRVKRKLHQMVGAYLDGGPPFQEWLERLRAAPDTAARHQVCRELLLQHVSTRERATEMHEIYRTLFAAPTPRTVLDLACGLNPLGRCFMPLPAQTLYLAADVHHGLIGFLNEAFTLLGFTGRAFTHDLLPGPPAIAADMVLLLKALPCLEQADRAVGRHLLLTLQTPLIAVSFPTASLGGNKRGMASFYQRHFLSMLPPHSFDCEMHSFASELVFLLRRLP